MNQLRVAKFKVTVTNAVAWALALFFSIFAFIFFISFVFTWSTMIVERADFRVFLFVSSVSLLIIYKSVRRIHLMHRLKQIEMAFSHCDRETLFQIASKTGFSPCRLLCDLRFLLSRGYIKNLVVDCDRLLLLVTKDNVPRILPKELELLSQQYADPSKLAVLPIYSIGLFWVAYALIFPLYRWTDFVLATILSLVVFLLARAKWKLPKKPQIEKEVPLPAEEVPAAVKIDTGNEPLDEVLIQMTSSMSEVTLIAQQIVNIHIQQQVAAILEVFGEMLGLLKAHPEHLPHVRTFVDYYVPLAKKLLTNYVDFSKSASQGNTVLTTLKEIEHGIETMTEACKKQLDVLYRDKAMDISLDIEIMQNLMKEQGLLSDDEELKGAVPHGQSK